MSHWEFEDKRANSVDLDEVAHFEPPHQDLRCLHIHMYSPLVLKDLIIQHTHNALVIHLLFISLSFQERKTNETVL